MALFGKIAQPSSLARQITRSVFFTGSTALSEGQGVCYARTTGTAASVDENRDVKVELPSSSNNYMFAGVAAKDYAAVTGGQWIKIHEPGSVCKIAINTTATVGTTLATCSAATGDAGRFGAAGFAGRGTARILQTIAAVSDTTTTPGVVSSSLDGSATYTTATKTVTKTGAFTNAVAGDKVVILAGATTATMAAGLTPGVYTIASVTSSAAVVLSTAAGSADSSLAFYCIRGNPTALAELQTGVESGLTQWITPLSATAVEHMTGGYTFVFGGATITTDSTATLATSGAFQGQYKAIQLMGALTTGDYVVDMGTTTTIYYDGAGSAGTTYAAVTTDFEFDGANDVAVLQYLGTKWVIQMLAGVALV